MHTETPRQAPSHAAQTGACAYLLHVLLQEAERRHSGFIGNVIAGVVRDHQSIPADLPEKPLVDDIFAETLRILRHANEPFGAPALEQAPKPRRRRGVSKGKEA